MRKLTLITLIIMLNSQAWAAATPQASRYDARIQQVIYNPQNVTVVMWADKIVGNWEGWKWSF